VWFIVVRENGDDFELTALPKICKKRLGAGGGIPEAGARHR
jgi:hypothetical protein